MHAFGNASQCKVEQPLFRYLNPVVQRGKHKLPVLLNIRRFLLHEWKLILYILLLYKTLGYLVNDEIFIPEAKMLQKNTLNQCYLLITIYKWQMKEIGVLLFEM